MRRAPTSPPAWVAYASLVALSAGYLLLDLVAGVDRSPLVPQMPLGVSVPSWTTRGAEVIGLDGLGHVGLTALALVVVGLMLCAFGVLLREAWAGRVGLAPVGAAAALAIALAVAAPLLLSRDVASYASYGRMVAVHDANPYESTPADFPGDPFSPVTPEVWRDTRSLYGPLFTLISAGVAGAFPSVGGTVLGFKVLAGVALALAAALAGLAALRSRPERAVFAVAAVGLNPVLIVHTVGGGHNDALIAALLAAAAALWVGGRGDETSVVTPRALGVTTLLALAALIKVVAGVALVVWLGTLVWRGSRRGRSLVIHGGQALLLGLAFMVPFVSDLSTIRALGTLAGVQGWASPARLVGRGAEALGDLVSDGVGAALRTAVLALFLAAFAWGLMLVIRRTRPDREAPAGWGVGLLLFALAAPYLLPWYVAWFVPLLALVPDVGLIVIGLAASGALALTGIPAEPDPDPGLWNGMILAVHYVAAPVMLALFVAAMRRITRP